LQEAAVCQTDCGAEEYGGPPPAETRLELGAAWWPDGVRPHPVGVEVLSSLLASPYLVEFEADPDPRECPPGYQGAWRFRLDYPFQHEVHRLHFYVRKVNEAGEPALGFYLMGGHRWAYWHFYVHHVRRRPDLWVSL